MLNSTSNNSNVVVTRAVALRLARRRAVPRTRIVAGNASRLMNTAARVATSDPSPSEREASKLTGVDREGTYMVQITPAHVQRQREAARETDYFNKSDREKLTLLLSKVRNSYDPEYKQATASLMGVAQRHGIDLTNEAIVDLLQWRHSA